MRHLNPHVGALPWRVTAEDKRWLENSSYKRQYSREFSGMLFSLLCYFISPSLLPQFKKTNRQTKTLISISSVFFLGSAIASSFIQPWLILFLNFLFIFIYLSLFFFFNIFFSFLSSLGYLNLGPLFPLVGLWFQNSTVLTGISRTRVEKRNCRGWRQLEAELSQGSVSLTLLPLYPLRLPRLVSLACPHARMMRVLKRGCQPQSLCQDRLCLPWNCLCHLAKHCSGQEVKPAQEVKPRESGHSILAVLS